MKNENIKQELQEAHYKVANLVSGEERLGLHDQQSANSGDETIIGIFENKQHALISLLLLCGLFVSIIIYFQTEDVIRREGIAAMALILLLCQIRLISEPTKTR